MKAKQGVLGSSGRAHLRGEDDTLVDRVSNDAMSVRAIAEARRVSESKYKDATFSIREAQPSDDNYILDNWTRSYLFSDVSRPVSRDVYNVEQRARIARILRYSRILCAVNKAEPREIKGWICCQPPISAKHWAIVHYICVHPNLQNQHIGTQLVEVARLLSNKLTDPLWITHWTMPMRRLADKWNLIYNPYLLEVLHIYD